MAETLDELRVKAAETRRTLAEVRAAASSQQKELTHELKLLLEENEVAEANHAEQLQLEREAVAHRAKTRARLPATPVLPFRSPERCLVLVVYRS